MNLPSFKASQSACSAKDLSRSLSATCSEIYSKALLKEAQMDPVNPVHVKSFGHLLKGILQGLLWPLWTLWSFFGWSWGWRYTCEVCWHGPEMHKPFKMGRRAREFQEHFHWVKIKKHPRIVSFFFLSFITGEMEKLYRHTTETQRTNQEVKLHCWSKNQHFQNTWMPHNLHLLLCLFIYCQVSEQKWLSTGSDAWQGWEQSSTSPSSTGKVQLAELG